MLFLAGNCPLAAQGPAFRLEEVQLPANAPVATIDRLFEDSRGFLWIGAYTGLYRYDGYELRHYRHNPADPHSIGDNKVASIAEDAAGNFWVGTQLGLEYFDLPRQQFRHFSDTARHGLGKVMVYDLAFDAGGTLWAATIDGLYRYDAGQTHFQRIWPENPAHKTSVLHIEPAGQGVYAATLGELYHIEAGRTPRRLLLPGDPGDITSLVSDDPQSQGSLWVGAQRGLFRIDRQTRQVAEVAAIQGARVSVQVKRGDDWWVCTDRGVFSLDARNGQAAGPFPLLVDGVLRPVVDVRRGLGASNNILWLSSDTRKLYKADALKERFHQAPIDLMEPMKHANAFCEMFEYRPGNLLIPRPEGPCLFDIYTGKLAPFPYTPDYNLEGWQQGVTCFLEEADSLLWIGTGGGLFLLDKKRGRFVPLERSFDQLKQLQGISIRKIHRDKKGVLWLATWKKGLFRIDFQQPSLRQYLHTDAHRSDFLYGCRTILGTRAGELWFGTRGGLLHYLEDRDSFVIYRNVPGDPGSMSENTAFCLYEDAEGNVWSGSYGGGLNCLDIKTNRFKHYTTDDGLLNNNVFSLLPDGKNNLWLLTYNGITRFDPARRTFRTFTQQQGLLNTAYDAFLYGKSRFSNTLFFGGTKGIDYFNPDSVSVSAWTPRVWFTDFKLFNVSVTVSADTANDAVLTRDIGFTTHLTLRYDQNVITFDFAALDYSAPQSVQYAYQLIGFDTAWQFIGNRRSVTFTNLNPGRYTLRVMASNSDGVWPPAAGNARSLEIIVTPPWWRTWWFGTLAVLTLAALIVAFYQYRIRQIRAREAIKSALNQRIAEVKMEALRSQMNPHFVFNCLTSLKLFVEKNETEKASDHISKFATLLRRVLDDARTETETVGLERELDTVKRYVELEMIRFKDKFDFRIEVDPEIDPENVEVPPLILQPYVENAILHGLQHKTNGKGLLLIKVYGRENNCNIVVEDNGVGRKAAGVINAANPAGRSSHGLNVSAERLEFFAQKHGVRASLQTTDRLDPHGAIAGTRVTLTFQTD